MGNQTQASMECPATALYAGLHLDTEERRRFAQVSHEYLIEQVQPHINSASSTSHDLNFNHPVKELCMDWYRRQAAAVLTIKPVNFYKLKLNGHDRFAARSSISPDSGFPAPVVAD